MPRTETRGRTYRSLDYQRSTDTDMTTPAPALPLTVQDLRARWLPQKKRLDSVRKSHPTSVGDRIRIAHLSEGQR
jgi:hypothetical protein